MATDKHAATHLPASAASDRNNTVAAFYRVRADSLGVASHLAQLAGFTPMVAALLSLTRQLETGISRAWSRLASAGVIANLAVATALQAVGGVP